MGGINTKNYFKGLLSGVMVMVIVFSIPVLAQNIEVFLNQVRININGIDRAQWGENYILDDGREVPYSIMYNDTTYLPLRKIGEFYNKTIYWNGDTKTAAMTAPQVAGSQKILTKKPDKNGNVWMYYTFTTDDKLTYLGVKDGNRNYERVYQVGNLNSVSLSGDGEAIYYVRCTNDYGPPVRGMRGRLYKILFLNDENTQDGEEIELPPVIDTGNVILDGDYCYRVVGPPGNGTAHQIYATNLITQESAIYQIRSNGGYIVDLELKSSSNNNAVLSYSYSRAPSNFSEEITVYKDNTLRFGEPIKVEKSE